MTASLENSVLFAINPYSQWRPDTQALPSLAETLLRVNLARVVVTTHASQQHCQCHGMRMRPSDPHVQASPCVEFCGEKLSAAHTSSDAALELNIDSLTGAHRQHPFVLWPSPAVYCRIVVTNHNASQSSSSSSSASNKQQNDTKALLAVSPMDVWASYDAWHCINNCITPLLIIEKFVFFILIYIFLKFFFSFF